jgi:putative transposase
MLEFLVWESQIRRQEMPRKRYTPEQIIQHLREAEVLLAQGKTIAQVCKKIGITDQTYYRWRKEYGGIRTDQAKRLKDLAKFNTDFGDRFWGCADTVRASLTSQPSARTLSALSGAGYMRSSSEYTNSWASALGIFFGPFRHIRIISSRFFAIPFSPNHRPSVGHRAAVDEARNLCQKHGPFTVTVINQNRVPRVFETIRIRADRSVGRDHLCAIGT